MFVKIIIYAIILIILLSLNAVFPPILKGAPNFLLLFIIFHSLKADDADFLWPAFFAGLLLDVYSPFYFGTQTLSFLLIATLIHYLTKTFFTSDPSVRYMAIIVFASFLTFITMVYIFNFAAYRLTGSGYMIDPNYVRNKLWVDLLLNLIFAVPIFFLTELSDRIILKFEHKRTNPF